ncbi:MAG TPA: ATP synthase F0 subunit B [Actinomycetota bacterium]|nr:ATP synthase F0 subunit B [Actinomycetota bacterium]
MSYMETIDQLDALIRNAKKAPLSASVVIHKEEGLRLLDALRVSMPQEHEQAQGVLEQRERTLAEAQAEAQRLVDQGRAERARLVARTEVVQGANAEAHRIVSQAEEAAERLKTQADDYVDAKLANFEIRLHKVLGSVSRSRETLRRRLEAAADDVPPLNLEDSGEISGPISAPLPITPPPAR